MILMICVIGAHRLGWWTCGFLALHGVDSAYRGLAYLVVRDALTEAVVIVL